MSMTHSAAMAPRPEGPARESTRLDSWKEIAGYLRRGVRTVQRWEREEGLPVHRLQHEKLGSVYAYPNELDAWFQSRGSRIPQEAETATELPSVAVLPFTDLSPGGDQAYFCEGIAEEIVNALSRIEGLRTAVAANREAGQQLGVGTLLEGSVRKAGDHFRIAVRLVEAETGFQRWSQRYDGVFSDTFAIQDQIAANLVQVLRPKSPAHEYYLRGRQYYDQQHPRSMEFAIRMFVRAIEVDPNHAAAYAGLSDCWAFTYVCSNRSEIIREQADWASMKALELDPQCAVGQVSRALVLSLYGRPAEADLAFETAARLDPDLFELHLFRARHCFALGNHEAAVEAYGRAMQLRPHDYQCPLLAAQVEQSLGRTDRAAVLRKTGIALAERHLRLHPDDARALYLMANGMAALGDRTRARQSADHAREIRPDDPVLLYNVACVFSLLGAFDAAMECLESAARTGFTQKGWYEQDSDLAPLRAQPRFRTLLEQLP